MKLYLEKFKFPCLSSFAISLCLTIHGYGVEFVTIPVMNGELIGNGTSFQFVGDTSIKNIYDANGRLTLLKKEDNRTQVNIDNSLVGQSQLKVSTTFDGSPVSEGAYTWDSERRVTRIEMREFLGKGVTVSTHTSIEISNYTAAGKLSYHQLQTTDSDPSQIISPKDAYNNATESYSYDSQGRLTRLTESVSGTDMPNGKTVTHTYTYSQPNAATFIVAISNTDYPSKVTTITKVKDNNGNVIRWITSEPDDKGVLMANTIEYNYYPPNEALITAENRTGSIPSSITLTDFKGTKVTQTYDRAGNIISFCDRVGNLDSYTYDAQNRLLTHTLKTINGKLVVLAEATYASALLSAPANSIKLRDLNGACQTYVRNSDGSGILSIVHADGTSTLSVLDQKSKPLTITYPDKRKITFGSTAATIEANGVSASYLYK